jgi:TonB family protein
MNQTPASFSFFRQHRSISVCRPGFMKYFLLFFFLPIVSTAQKIKRSEYDAAKKVWRIESFPVNLKTGAGIRMDAALRSAGAAFSLWLAGTGLGANTVIAGDEVILLLDNDSTVTLKSPSVQNFEHNANGNSYNQEYVLTAGDLEELSAHNLHALRKYSAEGYDDVYLSKENGAAVKELCAAFLAELKKAAVIPQKLSAVPGFPGGKQVLLRFLNRNLKPLPLLANGERKFAVVQFFVSADGSLGDLQIKHSAGTALDNELLRIFGRMSKWKPALQNGKQVDAVVTQPLTFIRTEGRLQIQF